ncbi:hypothetical protein BDM02DRAFT_3194343 [Thelephora ganbajun]|uniref:Uncharacterized protein n=1 Tax=Thelephora ganbajun TaxID=370292 RepID=A0ACB6YWS7_THEGA|nr:hypothetical protein BDM02DRAFT_3194343 [Thelephora ganbajun]
MPVVLEKPLSIQIITVGPVTDLYGKFAAEKLAPLMEFYPDRVYSKPEFTVLPPQLFNGANFVLVSSLLDLVVLASCLVSSSLSSPLHRNTLSQFKMTIKKALKSTRRSASCSALVWSSNISPWSSGVCTEDFHKRSINASRKIAGSDAWRKTDEDQESGMRSVNVSQDNLAAGLLTPPQPSNRDLFASGTPGDTLHRNPVASQQRYNALERANRQFAQENQNIPARSWTRDGAH